MQEFSDLHIDRGVKAVLRHGACLADLRQRIPASSIIPVGERLLATMQRTLEIAKVGRRYELRTKARRVSFEFLSLSARQGRLLQMAKCTHTPKQFAIVVRQQKLSLQQAEDCIKLHEHWRDLCAALHWASSAWQEPPVTVTQALDLIQRWRASS